MIKYILLIFVIFIVVYFYQNKIKIKYKTFLKKGFKTDRGQFGVYCYCGKQGSGKTYSVVEYLLNNTDKEIYANVKSIKGVKYHYISGFDDLLALRSKSNCIIFYDEIFTALAKSTKLKTDVLDFLSQMRKRKIIFITTAQEWLELNMTLRRYCRYQIQCSIKSFFFFSILIKSFHDAEQMRWSNDENEYVAPLLETTISKFNLSVANSYDTFEQISS